ncbi:MAG: diguanylate cyclase, partial [Oscillospiraceae bacterium]|nr:diguanylate cyclase [Oscillospiraceae bacterium]
MQKNILIVDSQPASRAALKALLCDQYEVLEAESRRAAIMILRERRTAVSAVLLDLSMPETDGCAVLEAMGQDPALSAIPVIAASPPDNGEAKGRALRLGARDFIDKPYDSAILHKRLANLIELYEANASLVHIERDGLTQLYNKDAFFHRATEILHRNPGKNYTLVVTDIERFKLVNDSFGTAAGDELLRYIAKCLAYNAEQKNGLCGRLNADHFVVLIPEDFCKESFQPIVDGAERDLAAYPLRMKITLRFGLYPVTQREVPIELMCDRA